MFQGRKRHLEEKIITVQVAAIVPAYNEAKTIAPILDVLRRCPGINQIIVVSDGSTDATVEKARRFNGVELVELPENRGKGGAIMAGLEYTGAQVLLLLDADLIGLAPAHICALLEPVMKGRAAMTIGLFDRGRVATDLAQKMAPFLSGQRVLRRDILEGISGLDITRFGLEVALHRCVEANKIQVETVYLPVLSHLMKEEKLGFRRGMAARLKMYWEIIRYVAWLHFDPK